MRYFLLFIVLSGCDFKEIKMDKPGNYSCSKEQMAAVDWQFGICMKTGFIATVCMTEAMRSNCTKREAQ
jgi:hypothetical protein